MGSGRVHKGIAAVEDNLDIAPRQKLCRPGQLRPV